MHLKPNHVLQLTKTVEDKILPLLRKQDGFKDEVFFVSSSGMDAVAISFWDRPESAESYGRSAYPQVLQALTDMLDGSPQVKSYNVISSTIGKDAPKVTV
jgi:hypothetical protein